MYLLLINLLILLIFSAQATATDRVSSWLEQMGCKQLLATHLETLLDTGTSKEQLEAAKKLANVYAILLSRATSNEDVALLARANSLLDKMPDAGTTELRLQLLRAAYLSAEQMIERYRLRYTDKDHADAAADQLIIIATKLSTIHDKLLAIVDRTGRSTESLDEQIGLSGTLLGWAYYYISLQTNSSDYATKAGAVFSQILQGDKPTLSSVSVDLKRHEQGARALLGIALVKELLLDPSGAEPWFEVVESTGAHPQVRMSIPMWRFFGDILAKRWAKAEGNLQKVTQVDRSLLLRLAAVHALENTASQEANTLANKSIAELISSGQLAMVSDIVSRYGISALDANSFITHFILADIAYKKAFCALEKDEPTDDKDIVEEFQHVVTVLQNSLRAIDATEFPMLTDDCELLKGFSFYYMKKHEESLLSFLSAKEGNNSETAIWMCLVNFAIIDELTSEQQALENDLVALYLSTWPQSQRATQLMLSQADDANSVVSVDDLLAIVPSDPSYEQSQRKASRLLYEEWRTVEHANVPFIGNKYVSIAVSLVREDHKNTTDKNSVQRSVVRALRLLEVSLHNLVKRVVAAKVALDALTDIQTSNLYSLDAYTQELEYRKLLLALYAQEYTEAKRILFPMILNNPYNTWSRSGSQAFWQDWKEEQFGLSLHEQFILGDFLLLGHSDTEIASPKLLRVALFVTSTGMQLHKNNTDTQAGLRAQSLIRVLQKFHPHVEQVLLLAARIESEFGDPLRAARHWKDISSASTVGSLIWLEAKYNTAMVLSMTSPQKALIVLDQHLALYPEYGADPYGSLLRALHAKLRGET